MAFKQRDLVLIPVPFTDLTAERKRPVVIISNDDYNNRYSDIIVMAVTSNVSEKEYSIRIDKMDMEGGDLPRPSMIRVDRIYTLNQSIVLKRFDRLKQGTFENVQSMLARLTENAVE